MTLAFDATAGRVALIEPDGDQSHAAVWSAGSVTGVVRTDADGRLFIDLGQDSPPVPNGDHVVASIFAPDALYRLRATARQAGDGVLALDEVIDLQRIQRRRWPRHALQLTVTLAPMDGADADFIGVTGRTLDIGMGGLRAQTLRRLPEGADPTVLLALPDGTTLAIPGRVVQADLGDDGCEYRVAFHDLDPADANQLAALLDAVESRRIARAARPR